MNSNDTADLIKANYGIDAFDEQSIATLGRALIDKTGAEKLAADNLPAGIAAALASATATTASSSATNGITAHAGGGQSSAVLLASKLNRVTTVGTTADSVKLPVSVAGLSLVVINAGANSLNLFPASGEVINALSADAAFAVAATKVVVAYCAVAGTWNTLLTA